MGGGENTLHYGVRISSGLVSGRNRKHHIINGIQKKPTEGIEKVPLSDIGEHGDLNLLCAFHNNSYSLFDPDGKASVSLTISTTPPQGTNLKGDWYVAVAAKPIDLDDGCELGFIQLKYNTSEDRWDTDAMNCSSLHPSGDPFYYEFTEVDADGFVHFVDAPSYGADTWYLLFVVQRCCKHYYNK